MKFKSHAQRKAVMSRLKGKSYKQLKQSGVFLKRKGDADKDGVKNFRDCKPLDPRKQGIIHDFIKEKEKRAKMRDKKLEAQQKKLLENIDKESTTLKKHMAVQKKINENKRLKQELKDLKSANFAMSPAGKIVKYTSKGARSIGKALTSKEAKRLAKKVFS